MELAIFKSELKQVLSHNFQAIEFIIFYKGQKEVYNTKRDLGLRLLELFVEQTVADIYLSEIKEQGYMGYSVQGFGLAIRSDFNRIERMVFRITT